MSSILVVDDEPHVTRVMRYQLENAGYQVEVASNGEKALDLLRERDFDVLITDINMPRMNGHELCEKLRQEFPERELVIFIVTSETGMVHREMAGGLEGVEFVEKPASLRHLIGRIEDRLARTGDPPG